MTSYMSVLPIAFLMSSVFSAALSHLEHKWCSVITIPLIMISPYICQMCLIYPQMDCEQPLDSAAEEGRLYLIY